MNAARRLSAFLLVAAIVTGCTHGSSANNSSTPTVDATATAVPGGGTTTVVASAVSVVPAPSIDDARSLALRWVASTGDLLKMGPIGQSELLRQQVASVSAETMTRTNPISTSSLLGCRSRDRAASGGTPLTIDVSIDA
jgi:hypothetical protein